MTFTRAIVIVLDSVGIGELPDAASYGDEGSDTLGHIATQVTLRLPTLRALGLNRVAAIGASEWNESAVGAVGRMAEASAGKDSVTGHWEMMGVVLERAFPVFPRGFDRSIIDEFSRLTGRGVLGNKAASGTQIIDEFGPEHMRTGALIVYTSADSVFQIAAHEEIVPVPELYRACEMAYRLVGEGLGVGRVIARPFVALRVTSRERQTGTTMRCRHRAKRCSIARRRRAFTSLRLGKSRISLPAAGSLAPFIPRATKRAWTM